MLKATNIEFGNVKGTIYDFPEEGDVLPMHWHDERSVHITVVAKGRFIAKGPSWEKTIEAGNVLDWKPFQQHEFTALEAGSRIVNIVKGGGDPHNDFGDPPKG